MLTRLLSLGRRAPARLSPEAPPSPVSPEAAFAPPDPLTADHALILRSAPLFAARCDRLEALDAALGALVAEGRLRPDQQEYGAYHRRRFAEAAAAIAFCLQPRPDRRAGRMAEIGSSITPMLYKRLFPELRVFSACLFHHKQLDGVVEEQVQIDLEKADLRDGTVLPFRDLDVLMLCEVLEHLVVNPANLFRSLAGSLAPGGLLYVTTPNFFRDDSRRRLAEGRNAQPIYPAGHTPADRFHFHVREYAMVELLQAMEAAGLSVEAAYYSDCWDSPEAAAKLPPDAWQNLVALGRKPGG